MHTEAMLDDLVRALEALWVRCNVKRLGGMAA
jgi:5-aminolevulinate synthase